MHPGRAALDYAVNRDRERVESARCSAVLEFSSALSIVSIKYDYVRRLRRGKKDTPRS